MVFSDCDVVTIEVALKTQPHQWFWPTWKKSYFQLNLVIVNSCFYSVPKNVTTSSNNKLNQNCPFATIFGTLTTKTIGHRQIFYFPTSPV